MLDLQQRASSVAVMQRTADHASKRSSILQLFGRRQRGSGPAAAGGGATPLREDVACFCSWVAEELRTLDRSLASDGAALSLLWCADAVLALKRMQAELLGLVRRTRQPAPPAGSFGDVGEGKGWLDQYMQETAVVLDFCNALKAAATRISRYCLLIDLAAAQTLNDDADAGGSSRLLGQLEKPPQKSAAALQEKFLMSIKLDKEIQRLHSQILTSTASDGDETSMLMIPTLVAKITTTFVLFLLVSALGSPPFSISLGDAAAAGCRVPELKPWCDALHGINESFRTLAGDRSSACEIEEVEEAVRGVTAAGAVGERDQKLLASVEVLRTRAGELKSGVGAVERALDEAFDEAIKGRKELMQIFMDEALRLV